MSGFLVNPMSVRAAGTIWDDQSEELRGSRKRLYDAEDACTHLGPRVAGTAQGFVATWLDRAGTLADTAQRHADALAEAASSYAFVDGGAGGELTRLMPWSSQGPGGA